MIWLRESGASINQKVFLPLFTIYMAIEARVHRLLLELLHSFHAKSVALNDALQVSHMELDIYVYIRILSI